MAEEEPKKLETETPTEPPPPPSTEPAAPAAAEPPKDVADDKTVIPSPPAEDKPEESKALAVVDKAPEAEPPAGEKSTEGSVNRDAVLARVETEKRISLIRAWEESEKSQAENNRKAAVEAELKKIEEQLEKKKAEYVEKMKNKMALIHKEAEEKRAMIEAKRGEDLLKAEELAAKYRATGSAPKKLLSCFGS
ncbi:hypothetical protein KPL70_025088 [Citrus sinensis]|uniref:Uncharacterized protein n=2 Tax=Citrus sinensis TaxID=2711 RepID=A0ACB8HSX1_CITSI|nr:remorin isoform X2 [Citrus x clementina]KAH9647139.1 hypothetical protein KPL70_025088 [Citrus sinensis]KAH9677889.1 hypothetical protein KPL71_025510 [Citrus sinensis]KDO60014.1 hypothetical protein CISIN_1g028549mg [Citrus sinensis]